MFCIFVRNNMGSQPLLMGEIGVNKYDVIKKINQQWKK